MTAKKTAEKVKTAVADKAAATEIEVKKGVRKAARKVKETVSAPVEALATAVQDKKEEIKTELGQLITTLGKIEKGKSKVKSERKAAERKEKTDSVKQAVKKPATRAKAAKMQFIIQSPMGGSITPEEIAEKIGAADTVYIRVDENKAYWVRKDETGSVDLW